MSNKRRASEESLRRRLREGKSWEGLLNCRRKTGDFVPLETKVIPVDLDHFVYVKQPPPLLRDKSFTDHYETVPPVMPPGQTSYKYFSFSI